MLDIITCTANDAYRIFLEILVTCWSQLYAADIFHCNMSPYGGYLRPFFEIRKVIKYNIHLHVNVFLLFEKEITAEFSKSIHTHKNLKGHQTGRNDYFKT